MTITVKDLMTSPVVTLFEEQTMPLAADIMRFKHIRHIPVVDDDNRMVGLLTHRDIMAVQLSSQAGIAPEIRDQLEGNVRIGSMMATDVWTVTADVSAARAGVMLSDHKFGCLPVVDENHRLVGILTEADYVTYASRVLLP